MDELYAQHFDELARFCTVLCRDGERGRDLAQETFLKALEHADQLLSRKAEERRSWLYRTAKNLFLDEARRNMRLRLRRGRSIWAAESRRLIWWSARTWASSRAR